MARKVPAKQAARAGRKAGAAPARKSAPKSAPAPKRPPEVSAAKWKGYSPGYQKRLAGFYRKHPGAPLQRARGKHEGEAAERRRRLEARFEARAARQSYRGGNYGARDPAELVESYRKLVRVEGQAAFTRLERLLDSRQKGQGRITSDELGFDWEDYDGESSELFYN